MTGILEGWLKMGDKKKEMATYSQREIIVVPVYKEIRV
jgi:hypothetical protein